MRVYNKRTPFSTFLSGTASTTEPSSPTNPVTKKVRNLFFGEIYDRDNLFPKKFVFRVESDELRRGVFDSKFFSKIHF